MKRVILWMLGIGALCSAALLLACNDDPVRPDPLGPWEETTLTGVPEKGYVLGLAFSATRGLAAGAGVGGTPPVQTFTPFLASLREDGTWAPVPGVGLPAEGLLSAVGAAAGGEAVIAGADPTAGGGFILDERGGWSRHDLDFGGTCFAASGDTLRFGGGAIGNQPMMVSTAADVWTPESLPFPANRNERGLEGIAARNGLWVACGFDDGAEGSPESPSRVLFLNRGSGWDRIDVPCGGCSNREFGAVAVSAPGGILLGGSITNFAGGADEYTAFLLLRSVAGDWAEIVLPDPETLGRVNDILIAADGTLYLACGMETGFLLRWPPGRGIEREAAIPSARIRRLAQAPDGTIWAAGSLQSGENGEARPAVWRRKT